MRRRAIVQSVLLSVLALLALMLSIANAEPSAPAQRVMFTKYASSQVSQVGDSLIFTLFFFAKDAPTIDVQIIDPNPTPLYLEIIPSSVVGGAVYSAPIDSVVWTGTLVQGTLPIHVEYRVRVTGMPTPALTTGYPVTNVATMAEQGTTWFTTTQTTIHIMPRRLFLPVALKAG